MPGAAASRRLLRALSPWGYERIEKQLETRPLVLDAVLYEVQGDTDEVYFPASGIVGLLTLSEHGDLVGATLMNSDSVLGAWLALGLKRSPWRALVLAPGEAQVMPVALFTSLLRDEPDFRQRMLDYCRTLFDLSTESIACSRLHDTPSRAAR